MLNLNVMSLLNSAVSGTKGADSDLTSSINGQSIDINSLAKQLDINPEDLFAMEPQAIFGAIFQQVISDGEIEQALNQLIKGENAEDFSAQLSQLVSTLQQHPDFPQQAEILGKIDTKFRQWLAVNEGAELPKAAVEIAKKLGIELKTTDVTRPELPHVEVDSEVVKTPSDAKTSFIVSTDKTTQQTEFEPSKLKAEVDLNSKPASTSPTTSTQPLIMNVPQWQAHPDTIASSTSMTYTITPQVTTSPAWRDAFAEQVLLLSQRDVKTAEIKLNPPELGPLDVSIKMHRDQATVMFTSQHAPVREAVEAALPRLREMFGENGVHLVDVGVSDQQQSQTTERDSSAQEFGQSGNSVTLDTEQASNTNPVRVSQGLVDFYA